MRLVPRLGLCASASCAVVCAWAMSGSVLAPHDWLVFRSAYAFLAVAFAAQAVDWVELIVEVK